MAFLALLSRIEVGSVWVDGCRFDDAGGGGGDGWSVPQASQERNVEGFMRVQVVQVQVSSMSSSSMGMMGGGGGDGAFGFGCDGRRVGGGGLVDAGMGGTWLKYLFFEFVRGKVLDSDLMGMGRPWLPQGFSALGGV